MFHKKFPPGHNATNYTLWYETPQGADPYRVRHYTHSYEPCPCPTALPVLALNRQCDIDVDVCAGELLAWRLFRELGVCPHEVVWVHERGDHA